MSQRHAMMSLALAQVLIFCVAGAPLASQQWKGKAQTENGVRVVRNPIKPIWASGIIVLEEDLSIGKGEAGQEYAFSRISGIAVDKENRIYVLDVKEAEIKVFDEHGLYLKTLEKKGQGPGEMISPWAIAVTGKGEIFVQDLNAHRIQWLSEDGAPVRAVSTADLLLVDSSLDSQDNIIGLVCVSGPDKQTYELTKFDPSLKPLLTFCSASRPAAMGRSPYNPFNPFAVWGLWKNGSVILGYSENYELKIFDTAGRPVMKIIRDYDPVKITDDEIEERRKRLPGPMAKNLPKYHTAYQDISADEDGRIFVRTWERTDDRQRYYFDVFDAEGRYITKVAIGGQPKVWKKNHLYTLDEDAQGYPMVKRYKVNWKQPNE